MYAILFELIKQNSLVITNVEGRHTHQERRVHAILSLILPHFECNCVVRIWPVY